MHHAPSNLPAMDSSTTTPSLELLADELRSAINLLLMQTSLASAVFTIMVQLLFFSTPKSRKRPVFWMNIVACLLGIMVATVGGIIQLQQITPPFRGSPWQMYNFQQMLMVFSPLFIDSVLLMRILAFYPITRTPWHRIVAVLAFSVLCKMGRIVVESLGLVLFYRDEGKAGTVIEATVTEAFRSPYAIVDWTLQMTDNMYVHFGVFYRELFLTSVLGTVLLSSSTNYVSLIKVVALGGLSGTVSSHLCLSFYKTDQDGLVGTFVTRIRGLFYIALGNFIFPIAINIAQIICYIVKTSFFNAVYLQILNLYVSIIGLAFATVWTLGSKQSDSMAAGTGSTWNQPPKSYQLHGLRDVAPVTVKPSQLLHERESQAHVDGSLSSLPMEHTVVERMLSWGSSGAVPEGMKDKVVYIS